MELIDVKKENAILACLVTQPELIFESDLTASLFTNKVNRDVYTVLTHIKERYENARGRIKNLDFSPLQVESVAQSLGVVVTAQQVRDLREVTQGGYVELTSFKNYCDDLYGLYVRTQLVGAGEKVQEIAKDMVKDLPTVIAAAENTVITVEDNVSHAAEPRLLSEDEERDFEECSTRQQTKRELGLRTGFESFDTAVGGLRDGTLTVIGARAKTGKSTFGLNVAYNICKLYDNQVPILYIDTEMSDEEQRHRLWSIASGVPQRHIENGYLTPFEKDRLEEARAFIRQMPLYHGYYPSFDSNVVGRVTRKYKNKCGVKLVIFDYIKLPDNADGKNWQEYQILGMLANTLKNHVAGRLGLPVLTFAQLNRDGVRQAQVGEIDETSISGSDRITFFCNTYGVLRKASDKEMSASNISKDTPKYLRYGKMANRFLHILATRNGGDDSEPIPIYFHGPTVRMVESGSVKPDGSEITLSEAIDAQIAKQNLAGSGT